MAKFLNYVEERNASAFKQMFEEAVAFKLMDALEEAKVRTAVRMSKEISKHVYFNPYEDNVSNLHRDSRGLLNRDAALKAREEGGFTTEEGRPDVEGLNPDEADKSPGMGGGFTNKTPLRKVWLKPTIPSGQSKFPLTKETSKGK